MESIGEPLPTAHRGANRRLGLRAHWRGVALIVGALGLLLLTVPLAGSGGALPATPAAHVPSPHVAAPVPVGGQHPLGNARNVASPAGHPPVPRDA